MWWSFYSPAAREQDGSDAGLAVRAGGAQGPSYVG